VPGYLITPFQAVDILETSSATKTFQTTVSSPATITAPKPRANHSQVIHNRNARLFAAFPRFCPSYSQGVGTKKAGSGKGSPLASAGPLSASQLHRFLNAEFLSAATRALVPALR